MNNERYQFNKITKFITDSYNDLPNRGTIVVKSVRGGFVVNGIKVSQDKDAWRVVKDKTTVSTFANKRTAILFAALISKNRYYDSRKVFVLDQKQVIYNEDKQRFTTRLNLQYSSIIQSKLSKAENELDLIEQQLRELEKSLSLQ